MRVPCVAALFATIGNILCYRRTLMHTLFFLEKSHCTGFLHQTPRIKGERERRSSCMPWLRDATGVSSRARKRWEYWQTTGDLWHQYNSYGEARRGERSSDTIGHAHYRPAVDHSTTRGGSRQVTYDKTHAHVRPSTVDPQQQPPQQCVPTHSVWLLAWPPSLILNRLYTPSSRERIKTRLGVVGRKAALRR